MADTGIDVTEQARFVCKEKLMRIPHDTRRALAEDLYAGRMLAISSAFFGEKADPGAFLQTFCTAHELLKDQERASRILL